MSLFSNFFGDANERYLKKLQPLVQEINNLENKFEVFSDAQLAEQSNKLKAHIMAGVSLDELLPKAFALVREASKRTLGQRHYDVQIVGGIVLHQGKIAEMKTGEGKTLVATLPAYLNALSGKGVYIVTVNDYLARRDTVWMGQIYYALGLTVGCINHEQSYLYDQKMGYKDQGQKSPLPDPSSSSLDHVRDTQGAFKVVHEFLRPVTKREAYAADIVYATNNELGFDYLRDNLAYAIEEQVQKRRWYAIVDEVDSILIDEARTPLIISAPDAESTGLYQTFSRIVPRLKRDNDYTVDEKMRSAFITDAGIERVEQALGIKDMYGEGGVRYVHALEQSLRAHVFYHRDKDYVVNNGEVIIVDEFTGRLMPGRRWSEGLHQAVEAKENVPVQKESRTFATITFQNYFRMFEKLSGMTGTAITSAEEFDRVYKLAVVAIPTNKPNIRADLSDRVYKTEAAKWNALVQEIKRRHAYGQPLLIGTTSIEKNELLSTMLKHEGIEHQILNAKNHEREGEIIAQAGRLSAVTVATNMAGRGVDIVLSGNPYSPQQADKVRKADGLHVIGTERHEARRIDNQLRGRCARQGDPGSTQFFISLDDELVRIFGGERIKGLMERFGFPEDQPIEHSLITRAIEQAQSKVEGNNFDLRKYVLEFDDVMNKHREAVYGLRQELLEATEHHVLHERIVSAIGRLTERIVRHHLEPAGEYIKSEDIEKLQQDLAALTGREFKIDESATSKQRLGLYLKEKLIALYHEKETEIGEQNMPQIEQALYLRTLDQFWVLHLEAMEHLRDSVRLRAYGQREPLAEYKIEGQKLFENLLKEIDVHVAQLMFRLNKVSDQQTQISQSRSERAEHSLVNTARNATNAIRKAKISRNDPCWCNSGKKYKKCHGS